MTTNGRAPAGSAADLRRRFDTAFASPPPAPAGDIAALLAIRLGGDPYAVRIAEIGSFGAARKIVRVPDAREGLLGLAADHGVVLPVFDLAAIIGYAREGEAPRWFVSSKGAAPVAFAFAEFDGYVEVPLSQVRPATGPETRSPHLHEVLHDRDVLRGVVSLASIVGRLNDRPAVAVSGKER